MGSQRRPDTRLGRGETRVKHLFQNRRLPKRGFMITVKSAVLVGIESRPVTITVEESERIQGTRTPAGGIVITGLSPAAMRETRVRLRSSLAQCGVEAGD